VKVLLLFPPGANLVVDYPPLGLGYIASVLEQAGYNVNILDALLEKKNVTSTLQEIEPYNPDIIGITVFTPLYLQAKEVIKKTREKFPQIITIAGGPHATVLPKETLEDMKVDYVVIGEGEVTVLELVRGIEKGQDPGKIKGIAFLDKGEVRLTPRRDFISDLDDVPFPARHLMKIKRYGKGIGAKIVPCTTILTSRGCPFNCSFCCNASLWHRKYRQRSPQNVVEEMVEVYHRFGIRNIYFPDDLFTANTIWIREICSEIASTAINFKWRCLARVDTLDREILKIMRDSGCYAVEVGVESGSELILKNMNKNITIPQAIQTLPWARELDFDTHVFFMLGYIGETEDTIRMTINLAQKLNPEHVSFSIATPIPGTDFYKEATEKKLIVDGNWQDYDYNKNAVSRTETLSSQDLLRWQDKAYAEFYLRKEYLWQNVIAKIGFYPSDKHSILRPVRNLKFSVTWLLKGIFHYFR